MTKKPKLIYSIRAKLISAVAMLLVAVIMVVSSTYAWFTLSTAPEVTGITTAIGANGALEMALNVGADPLTGQVDSSKDENTYWGNIVDLLDAKYGLNNIILYPSALNSIEAADSLGVIDTMMLKTPVYGEDGRVSEIKANTIIGKYDEEKKGFYPSDGYGVRGVGTSSGMTDRQLAYRKGAANAATSMTLAATRAQTSLNQNGSGLASLAVKLGMDKGGTTYTFEELAVLGKAIDDLQKGSIAAIVDAYKYAILGYAASAAVTDDTLWNTVETAITNGQDLSEIQALVTNLPEEIKTGISKITTTVTSVNTAKSEYELLIAGNESELNADGIKAVLRYIVDPDAMELNGFPIRDVVADASGFVNHWLGLDDKSMIVTTKTGGGVYADIADHAGDYSASVVIDEVSYGTLSVTNLKATMNVEGITPTYLESAAVEIKDAGMPEGDGSAEAPLTEFYGYIIDLFFQTNALDSQLLLQTEGIDRIYADNNNPLTQGSGSNMTFTATTNDLSAEQIQALMKSIRIVFFSPTESESGSVTNEILGYARLDVDGALVEDPDAITATGGTAPIKMWGTTGFLDSNVILDLEQNTPTKVSVLVYMDGADISNGSVAAGAASSMTGSMNLQFASSANLVPMENGDLHLD